LFKFGVYIYEDILNFYLRHWTGLRQTRPLWTGPCWAKTRLALPNYVIPALLWDITQHSVVFPYRCFGTTYCSQLQRSENPKERTQHDGN